ncbi:MAG: hypothetical protein GX185_04780 [Tissierellia bacterium]|nr:hypothetical protein [Tissierellia bacterium]
MVLETDFEYTLETELADLNEDNYLKPHGYQKLFVALGDMHLNNININVDTTMKYNLAWAFISISMEVVKPVEGIMKLKGKTWHSQRRGPFFRREYIFTDEEGQVYFKGASFSVLLDLEKRTIFREKEAPFYIYPPIEELLIDAKANRRIKKDFEEVQRRIAYNSYIDCLGHVNNCRYTEFAYDTFSQEEVRKLKDLKRMEIYFRSELRKGDEFSILKRVEDDNIFIRGDNHNKADTSFEIIFQFK